MEDCLKHYDSPLGKGIVVCHIFLDEDPSWRAKYKPTKGEWSSVSVFDTEDEAKAWIEEAFVAKER